MFEVHNLNPPAIIGTRDLLKNLKYDTITTYFSYLVLILK